MMALSHGLVLLIAISNVSAQFILGRAGAGAGGSINRGLREQFFGSQRGANFLDGAEQNIFFRNQGLDGRVGERQGLDAFGQSAANENIFSTDLFGEQLAADQTLQAEEIANQAAFQNVDAVQNSAGNRDVALSVIDQQSFNVGDKVSFSQAANENAGARVLDHSAIAAQNKFLNDGKASANVASVDEIQARNSLDGAVQGIEQVNNAQNARVQGQDNFLQQASGSLGLFNNADFGLFRGAAGRRRR